DVALFNAMLHIIWREGLLNERYVQEHTEGFAFLESLLLQWPPERASQVCELPVEKIVHAARAFAKSRAALSLYCQGLNQSANGVRRALGRAEFVVVQEAFRGSETCDYADVILPAASWAEKEGTVTNSERRISRVRAAVPPPGEARPDWRIAADFALRLQGRL